MENKEMLIPIDQIKPSPNPVRTTWDEDKMNELVQSIKEQGLIVPIKVREVCPVHGIELLDEEPPPEGGYDMITVCKGSRPSDDPTELYECWQFDDHIVYEIVYGHRRTEAHRRLNKKFIEVVLDYATDDDVFFQALSENVQREALEPMDEARDYKEGIRRLHKMIDNNHPSARALSRKIGVPQPRITTMLKLLDEDEEIQDLVASGRQSRRKEKGRLTPLQVDRVGRVMGEDTPKELKTKVLKKTAKEGLSSKQATTIAKAVKHAPDPETREAILESSYEDFISDPVLIHSTAAAKRKTAKAEKRERQENPREVKEYFDSLKVMTAAIDKAIKVAEYGKFAPESTSILAGKHQKIIDLFLTLEKAIKNNG